MNRRTSSTVGTPRTASTGLTATTTLISTLRSSSATSLCIASRLNSMSASRIAGSEILTAAAIMTWFPRPPMISATATATAQVSACVPVPIVGPAKESGKAWKTTDAAPYDRPVAATVNTLR